MDSLRVGVDRTLGELLYTLSILPFLPSLTSITITGSAIITLAASMSLDDFNHAWKAAERCTSLVLHKCAIEEAKILLGLLPDAVDIDLSGLRFHEPSVEDGRSLLGDLAARRINSSRYRMGSSDSRSLPLYKFWAALELVGQPSLSEDQDWGVRRS